jgi:hypothetical protein
MTLLLLLATLAAPSQGPTCQLPDGATIAVELARTDEEKALGLMFRDTLPANFGMLFLFDRDDYLPFWMKNTLLPLDFVWLDKRGTVVDVKASVPPCKLDPCPSYKPSKPARYVLELPAGAAAAHRLAPGATLHCTGVPGFPAEGEAKR